MNKCLRPLAACAAFAFLVTSASAWISSKVQTDANGRLTYPADANGNRIPDFSHAGYKGGGVALPTVPVRVTISPVSGDDTASIQAALDQVGNMPLQSDGYRGAVLLTAGVYDVAGTLRMNKSGVVLAGVGNGDSSTSNTILRRTGTSQADVITAGGGANDTFKSEITGTRREITTSRVTVGSRTFTVSDATGYGVGDNIIVHHPSTAAWIAAMNNGGVTDENVWTAGSKDIRYHRYITAISGNTITVDAPVFNHLDRALAVSSIYKYDRTGILTNIGIEDLQIDIVTAGSTSETHCEDAVQFIEAEDSWIRDCTIKHFWHAGVQFVASTRCTVERVRAIEPHSVVTGGRRYNFSTYHAQLILFQDCFASDARHGFIANGTMNDSGNVVLRGTLDRNITFSEGHRHWSTGILFDNIVATNRVGGDTLGFYNRGNYGTGHGWAVGHGVIWNCNAAGGKILVQQPPTAQNYAIGCFGNVTGSGPFAGAAGFIEGANTAGLQPASLYLAQLEQRQPLATPAFSPGGGTYSTGQTVTISTTSPGASIRYTTDGSTPTATNGTLYSGAVTIGSTTTLKAVSFRTGWTTSPVATATYTISLPQVAAPSFSPGGGTYTGTQNVTITSGTSGASIRYTTNGTNPTSTTGTLYSGAVSISSDTTLKAIAYKAGQPDSNVTTASYVINTPPAGTTVTSADGFYNQPFGSPQTGTFTATFNATSSVSPANAVVGFSSGNATGYTSLAAMIRFNTTGFIDARNGGSFTASSVPFSANTTYAFRLVINVATRTYSAFVTAPGGSEQTLGTNLAFRTEQAGVTNLTNSVFNVNATPGGSLTVGTVTITPSNPTAAKLAIPASAVTASAHDSNVPANVVDNNLATRWSASGDGQWIQFDLGASKTVTQLKIAFYSGDTRSSTFDVQVGSSPTGPFTTINSYTSSGTTTALQTFNNTDTSTRYVRLLGHGNSANLWNSYTEVEVWGF